jgi:toxin YoeB
MIVAFANRARDDYRYRQETDKAIVRKINRLIVECLRHPFVGVGKPEPLRGDLAGFRSRRIDREHRLVYRATPTAREIVQCRCRC